jgi:hypothetical protein
VEQYRASDRFGVNAIPQWLHFTGWVGGFSSRFTLATLHCSATLQAVEQYRVSDRFGVNAVPQWLQATGGLFRFAAW